MTEQTEREVLEALWKKLFPVPDPNDEPEWQGPGTLRTPLFHTWEMRRRQLFAMLDAEAYESAALMLVPKGQDWAVGSTIKGDFFANLDFDKAVHSTTPALALCAAIEAALAREGE